MRKNYLMKSISIILMLLAMMFSCQPVSEDIDSGNSNSNNTSQGGTRAAAIMKKISLQIRKH